MRLCPGLQGGGRGPLRALQHQGARALAVAGGLGIAAAAREGASGWQVHQLGHGAGNGGQPRRRLVAWSRRLQLRPGGEQAARVGWARRAKMASVMPLSTTVPPYITCSCSVLRDHSQIVRDQQQGHGVLGHQFLQQIENLLLHGHVQRRGRFVGDQQVGPAGQGHGDGDALALAARELVRIVIKALGCAGNAHALQQGHCALARGLAAQALVVAQRLGHLAADAVHGVEGRHGLLKHHGHAVAAQAAQRALVHVQQLLAVEPDAAVHLRMLRQQAHQRQGGQRLAAARLADQAQRGAALQDEFQVLHGTRAPRGSAR